MRNYIYLLFALILSCKTVQTTTESSEGRDFRIIEAPEFSFLTLGQQMDLGDIILTKLEGSKAAISLTSTRTIQQHSGQASNQVDRSRTEININSNNKDKSRELRNSGNKITDKSQGDIDKSRVKTKVPNPAFLRKLFVFVLLALVVIWFFYPRIKKLKPPFL